MRKFRSAPPGRLLFPAVMAMLCYLSPQAQTTFPVNGVAEPQTRAYAFTHATLVQDGQTTVKDASLVIRDGKIVAVGTGVALPKDAVVIDCSGKYIYPSFIDIYADYGIATPQRERGGGFGFGGSQFISDKKGAYGWNQSIKPEVSGVNLFAVDDTKAQPFRQSGFGTVLTHQSDGIARGTGVLVTLGNETENMVILKEKASANYSFNRGTSTQSYPSSMMGMIALLRQTYLDAQWYKNKPASEGVNLSLEAWNDNQSLPQIFDAGDKWNDLRADRIGDEFGVQYIIKGGGNEYQRIDDIVATKATYILPLDFPQAMDVSDPDDARYVSLEDMKHWELAPGNPAALEKAGVPFCLSTADMRDPKQFMANLHKALEAGLSEQTAFEALTKTPATLLGVYDMVGSIEKGKLANFIITSGPVFEEKTTILQNWIKGKKYDINSDAWSEIEGMYTLSLKTPDGTATTYTLEVKGGKSASVLGKDTIAAKFSSNGKLIGLSFSADKSPRSGTIRLSGTVQGEEWSGNGYDAQGNPITWTATYAKALEAKTVDSSRTRRPGGGGGRPGGPGGRMMAKVTYPMDGYGWEAMPKAEDLLIKNATVWTNEKEGHLEGTDVLVRNGKIARIGKNLSASGAKVIDGTGKYLTPGIIDEHSHIAAASINEGGQSITSEVRIGDNLNPDDINIYRQLAGGVTTSHILHGSANTIGGQTQLIKLRWGADDEGLKFKGADPFIKFALGENVKRTRATSNNRYPDTRMGVSEVMMDAFTRATDYEKAMKADKNTRRDLELDALVEIMNKKRFITCHSYVQSEIVATMKVAEKFGFRINTFTHILEGYKVADKMKVHGANASTFSDWWAYKLEVQDAIAYNATIMNEVGLNVCVNSDDAEMARRLNQEAAKSVKYGGMSEEDAFKMVTLNPAKALHIENQVGSIKVGKDADLVLWTDNPLSIYARAEKTIVDGIVYYDMEHDMKMRADITKERNRLVQKMLGEKRGGASMRPARPSLQVLLGCGDHDHHGNFLTIDGDELEDGIGSSH